MTIQTPPSTLPLWVQGGSVDYAKRLCENFPLTLNPKVSSGLCMILTPNQLQLAHLDHPKQGAVVVDFASGGAAHRRKFGGGKGQSIAKAVGLNKGATPSVLDATAGLGRDAFVLASLGCEVTMLERNPFVAALLEDGLNRASVDVDIGPWIAQRLKLQQGSLLQATPQGEDVDVVYLDPMFPPKPGSALVKKEMRVFHDLVGNDHDADGLLEHAWARCQKRVVVKRPDYAPFLAGRKPSMSIKTKKNRFDVYVKAAMV